jgi:methionine sulfoxide reductase heme-binding subunit
VSTHIWWFLSRSSGIVAWLMLTASVLWGIVLATDLFPKWRKTTWLLDMHRWLAGLTFFFIAGHLGTLLFDKYTHFGVGDFLVPFASSWRPTAIALGVIGLWLLVAIQVTALATQRLSKKAWRIIHIASYGVFWAVSVHAALAGTDTSKTLYVVTAIVALAAVVFAASYRALSHHLPKRRRPQAGRRPSPVPVAADHDTTGPR